MRILHDFATQGQRAQALAILLPGALQQPEDFIQAGFIDAVRRRTLSIDLALVDPGLQYITDATDGSALQRIDASVVPPAQRRNYRHIWLAGISIGGFMAIAYADCYPGRVNGLCLLAPYPGSRILTAGIRAAGIENWHAPSAADNDPECRVWQWLTAHRAQPGTPQIHLGYGTEDRFAPGQQLMAQTLAASCVGTVAGGHDWPVWLQLWENFLDRAASGFGQRTTDTIE
ncbi:MAG: hypothetical protein JWQ21_920 [Herminiimonas sp.]|nr:hypothetical protein [Herminiimonas sp.]